MNRPAFDPFGESVPSFEASIMATPTSRWLKSTGTWLFWILVAGIVLARAVYFEPGSFSFERAMAWVQGQLAFL